VTFFNHQFHDLSGNKGPHIVIQASPGENDLWIIANLLGFMCEIIRINTDAMPSNKTGAERQKIPFCPGSLKHFKGIDAHFVKYNREFVYKGNVNISLRVFDHFGCFSYLYGCSEVGSGSNYTFIQIINFFCHFGGGAGSYFFNFCYGMYFVSRIDPFGGISAKEACIEVQSTEFFQDRHTFLFCCSGVHSRFIDHDISFRQNFTHNFRGFYQGAKVWSFVFVDGSGNGDNIEITIYKVFDFRCIVKICNILQFMVIHFQGAVMPIL